MGLEQVDWLHAIFGLSRGEKLWTVPWTGHTIFQVCYSSILRNYHLKSYLWKEGRCQQGNNSQLVHQGVALGLLKIVWIRRNGDKTLH